MPAAGWRDGGDRSTSQLLNKWPQTQTRHDYRTVSDQNWTYIPNQFLCVHWSWWENSKQCIFSRLKKVYPTTSDMLSFASVRQLWNLPTSILLDLTFFLKSLKALFIQRGGRCFLLSVAVAVRHGEDVGVEDAKLRVEGQDGVFALVVFAAAAVGVWKNSCKRWNQRDGWIKNPEWTW